MTAMCGFYERRSAWKWNAPAWTPWRALLPVAWIPSGQTTIIVSRSLLSVLIRSASCMRHVILYRPCRRTASKRWFLDSQIAVFIQSSPFARAENRYSSAVLSRLLRRRTPATWSMRQAHIDPDLQTRHRLCEGGGDAPSMTDGTEQLSLFDERPVRRAVKHWWRWWIGLTKSIEALCSGLRRDSAGFSDEAGHAVPRYTTRWNELLVVKTWRPCRCTLHGQFRKEKKL